LIKKVHPAQSGRPSKPLLALLLATAVVSGAMVMVIEVMGSRVIGPFFGVSLFVWTSLIAVTMISLAVGYAVGGWLADLRATPRGLYLVILMAGVLVLAIPTLTGPVLRLSYPLGLRLGSFVGSLLLFGPPLALLGCVTPLLAKIATREMQLLGRTVGGLYALSTVGSVVGTLLTGYVLIAYLGVSRIIGLVGLLLILLSVFYFVVFERKWLALGFFLIPGVLFPDAYVPGMTRILENGTRVTSVATTESFYGRLKVVDYSFESARNRELVIDGLIQGGIDMASRQSIYPYSYLLDLLARAFGPEAHSALVMGLGVGLVPQAFEEAGIRTDVVDIDPAVVTLAEEHFGFSTKGKIFVQDARDFLTRHEKTYDIIVLDVFSGDITPGYLLSQEAVLLVDQRLADDGVLAINLVGRVDGDGFMTASVVRTLETVFDHVDVYGVFAGGETSGVGNLAVFAYSGEPRLPSFDFTAIGPSIHPRVRAQVLMALRRSIEIQADLPFLILTDDYNPIDFFDAELREAVRKAILEGTSWEILLESG